ncbi:MAG TPA: hypothetical protein VGV13_16935 [Methylomirabilota bacterium]|jgi:hypothetical protein|nr:hypothetical protein [Methylomirabilota bacterium]
MEQIVSVAGALLILAAYAGNQLGLIDRTHARYSWMNLIVAAGCSARNRWKRARVNRCRSRTCPG